ncbi:MAG: TrkA C-terminal domain-containing protein [Nitrospirae bacterium]|nr:TrkA C-terminal domain-containing protein [Nitrospirota bacterium]
MKFMQPFRREIGIVWAGLEKVVVSAAEQTTRQVEIARLSFGIHEYERQLDNIFERMGRFLYECQAKEINAVADDSICRSSLSEYKRLQNELKLIERRRYDLKEENVAAQWAEFIESVHRSGMTLDSVILPFHLKPSTITLQELALPTGILVIAIQRKERFIQPHGTVMLNRGDRLTLLGPPQQMIQVMERFSSTR